MPRQSYTSTPDHTTDAGFTAWAKQLSDAIKAVGLIQTSDTGQVDWTTVKTRPAVNTYTYYEVYRFPDALQATRPIFIKVEYGTATAGATVPNIRVGVGLATNGAGGLTFSTTLAGSGATTSATPQTTYVCYKDSTFTLAWGAKLGTGVGPQFMCVIERSRSSNGTPNGNGAIYAYGAHTANLVFMTYSFVPAPAAPTSSNVPCLTNAFLPQQSGSVAAVNIFNWFCLTPDLGYLTGAFTYKNAEIPQYSELDVALIGTTSRHYLCLGNRYAPTTGWGMHGATVTADVPAILWEV